MKPAVRIVGGIAAFLVLLFVIGRASEAIGNWSDAHPERSGLVGLLWNALLLIVSVFGAVVLWRRYRRPPRTDA